MNQKYLYVMLMNNQNELNLEVIRKHVEHLRAIDESGQLEMCGPFTDFRGGMVILKTASIEEAHRIAQEDPFIAEGYKTYELRTLEWARRDNHYLFD